MKTILITLGLLFITDIVIASDINIGDPLDNLLVSEGDATIVEELIVRETPFVNYYYEMSNRSYLVNKETDLICDIVEGKTGANCFPCERNQTSATCP